MKTNKIIIKSNDSSLIGQRLVFSNGISTTIGTITHVTKDRVIYIDEDGKEGWTWLHPNKKWASFDTIYDRKFRRLHKALTLETAHRELRKQYNALESKYTRLTRQLGRLQELLDYSKREE